MSKHLPPPKKKHTKQTKAKAAERADAEEKKILRRKMPETVFSVKAAVPVLAALAVFLLALMLKAEGLKGFASFAIPALLAGAAVLLRAVLSALRREIVEGDLLILAAVLGAFCLKEYAAGAAAMLLYRFTELAEAFLEGRSAAALKKLREGVPSKAGVETEDGIDVVSPELLQLGDIVVVMPGEVIPADGVITEGMTALDTSFLSGESEPRTAAEGAQVLSGSVNLSQMIKMRVLRPASESAAASLVELAEIAHTNRSGREKLIARFTAAFTPAAAIAGILIGLIPPLFNGQWLEWLRRGVLFLLMASPCGLIASVPAIYFGGIKAAARQGIFLKGTRFLEILAKTQTAVFEKTGVITERTYSIEEIFPRSGDGQALLTIAAKAEEGADHPIAQAIRAAAGNPESQEHIEVETIPCRGISAFSEGKHVYVGNAGLMMDHGVTCAVPRRKGTDIHVAVDNGYLGYFLFNNKVRDGAFDALESIRQRGVRTMVMLTGDLHSVARQIASSLSFDMVKTELDPDGKLTALEYLLAAKGDRASLIFVGDGRGDAKLFERADAGIVLGALEEPQAISEADVVIMGEDIRNVAALMRLAKQADVSGRLSVTVSLAARLGALILGLCGALSLTAAVEVEAVAAAYVLFNALRALWGFQLKPED